MQLVLLGMELLDMVPILDFDHLTGWHMKWKLGWNLKHQLEIFQMIHVNISSNKELRMMVYQGMMQNAPVAQRVSTLCFPWKHSLFGCHQFWWIIECASVGLDHLPQFSLLFCIPSDHEQDSSVDKAWGSPIPAMESICGFPWFYLHKVVFALEPHTYRDLTRGNFGMGIWLSW